MFQQQQDDSLHIFYVSVVVWLFACSATVAAVDCEFVVVAVEDDSDVVLALDALRDDDVDGGAGSGAAPPTCVRTLGMGWVVGIGCCCCDCTHADVVDIADDDAAIVEVCSWDVDGAVATVGVCGGRGESTVPLVLPVALVLRVKNQQSMGVGLPFITTGPRYSRWNESSWLISWQSNLQMK